MRALAVGRIFNFARLENIFLVQVKTFSWQCIIVLSMFKESLGSSEIRIITYHLFKFIVLNKKLHITSNYSTPQISSGKTTDQHRKRTKQNKTKLVFFYALVRQISFKLGRLVLNQQYLLSNKISYPDKTFTSVCFLFLIVVFVFLNRGKELVVSSFVSWTVTFEFFLVPVR